MNAAPIPIDTQDFQFKHASTQHVCDNLEHVPIACSLIVADGKRGLLYIAYESKLTILKYNIEPSNRCVIDYDFPHPISKLSVSCDYSFLGVTFNKSTAYIYNADSLSKNSLEILHEIQLSSSSSNAFGYDLRWNPAVPGMFCTVASDHTIGSFQIKAEQKSAVRLVAMEKIAGLEALCVAWSPKGKQLVVGCKNGNIVQLKPELRVARTIPGPSPAIGEVIAILWISNYQFCAAYSNISERRVNVLIVNAPKGETIANFMCYEDITYGMPDMEGDYIPRYYFDHIPEWNLIIAASSSSSEIAVLGSRDNGTNWEQWQMIDSGRAQLPLIRTTETYPVGMTIDKSSTIKLPWGPESTLPNSVPILHIFGTSGQIISFHMVNLQPNCPSLCSPPSEPATMIPPPRPNMFPSEISFNNPGITSTPRPKQTELPMDRSKALPNADLFNNPLTFPNVAPSASIIPQPIATAPKPRVIAPMPAPPVTHVDLKIPKPRQEKVEMVSVQKSEQTRLSPVKEVSIVTPTPENAMLNESICWRAFKEELIHFEKELKMKLEPQTWQVGTEEERQKLITQCAEIDEFWRELRETTNSLSNEVAYLKALLLQSFAWVEETKSRNSANDSVTSRDRHDRSKIQELQRSATYVQSQLIQAMKAIDMQWTENQSQERSKMKIPSLEYIYQGLTKHSEIIARQQKIIEQLMAKLKALHKKGNISSLNRSIANLDLNVKTLGSSSGLNVNGGIIEMRCRTIANNAKNFTREKQMKLREILLNNTPKVIKPIIPTPVQDRLEATLTSLSSLSPMTAPPKQKFIKLVPASPAVTKVNQIVVTTTTTTTPVQKTSNTSQNPLASLTSIVANIGTTGSEATLPPASLPHFKSQPMTFSMSAFPAAFGNTPAAEKINPSGNTQFDLKQNIMSQSSNIALPSSLTQPSAAASAFPKVINISFGAPDQKVAGATTPADAALKEITQKDALALKPRDIGHAPQSTAPLFDTSLFTSSVNTASPTSEADPSTTYQNQISTSLGSSLTLSFKDSSPQVTTSQQTVFSFASPSSTTVTPKTTPTTTNNVSTANIQTFSFAPKPLDPPVFSSATPERFPTVKAALRDNLDLSKMTVGLSTSNPPDELPTSIGTSANPFGKTFSELSTPISSTINFGKVSLPTPDVSLPQQENKSPINLPSGTTIEKIGGFTGALGQTTLGSSIFGGNSTSSSNAFGASIFGGTSMSLTASQAVPLSTSDGTPTVTSTSIFSTPSNNVFSQNPTTSSNAPPPPTYRDSRFSNMLGDPTKNTVFGTSQVPEVSVFGKHPATSLSSTAPTPSSPFAQPTSTSLSLTNPPKSSSTTAAPTGFFANSANSANNSIFGGVASDATAPSKLFGGNSTSPTTSLFVGAGAAAPSPFGGSIFGSSSTFGAQPAIATTAPTSAFGGSPTFSAKPIFGGQPAMFGTAKPEFSSPFGSSGFGSTPGFGGPSNMASTPPSFGNSQMGKVFGSPTGSSTFESLAGQNNQLTFDSLARKSPSPEKPPSFSGGSSFSSWR